MANYNCDACANLYETSPEFVVNGVSDAICESLQDNTGLNPSLSPIHTDAEDLHDANDCLIGMLGNEVSAYDACDWKEFMKKFIGNEYNVQKGIICALAGIWKRLDLIIEAMSESGYIAVVRTRRVRVEPSNFGTCAVSAVQGTPATGTCEYTTGHGLRMWWGQAEGTEPFYDVTVNASDMDDIAAVVGQPIVTNNVVNAKTVSVQRWEKKEDGLIHIDFDPFEFTQYSIETAQPMEVDFIVIGKKKINL